MMKFRNIFGYIFTIFVVSSVILNINKIDEVLGIYPQAASETNFYATLTKPQFIHLGGNSFKTVGSPPIFADDCIGCGDLGDIYVSHSYESAEMVKYNFDANCHGTLDVVEKSVQLNETGEKIGERCIAVYSSGKAEIVWTEGSEDLWFITAPTLEIVQEFEKSATYKSYKYNAK